MKWTMPRDMAKYTGPEAAMLKAIHAVGLPEPVHQHRFHPTRRWRLDFAWPDRMVALEVEGLGRREKDGTWNPDGGGHQTRDGFTKDVEKYNEAVLLGWTLIRVTSGMITKGSAIEFVERALASEAGDGNNQGGNE